MLGQVGTVHINSPKVLKYFLGIGSNDIFSTQESEDAQISRQNTGQYIVILTFVYC